MDLDESMTTSTSSTPSALQDIADNDESFEDDDLFPEPTNGGGGITNNSNHPQTPPANDHLNAAAPGELSPPRSQPRPQSDEGGQQPTRGAGTGSIPNGGHGPAIANIAATRSAARPTATTTTEQREELETNAVEQLLTGNDREERPGWGWKSKKAQEEMQRAWDNITDRDFSLKEYGDVVMLGKAQLAQQ